MVHPSPAWWGSRQPGRSFPSLGIHQIQPLAEVFPELARAAGLRFRPSTKLVASDGIEDASMAG